MHILTDFPERLVPGTQVYIGSNHTPITIERAQPHSGKMLITFEAIRDREQAGMLRSQVVYVHRDSIPPLPEGEYYHHELLGLQVVTDTGRQLGKLVEIIETGANDVYLVRADSGEESLVPAIDEVILKVDLDAGEIQIHPLPGLLSDA
jgi:16S rRNA processing protein RimM